jgi:hypothetical protein
MGTTHRMKKILLCGDSFSADWGSTGWPQMLSKDFNITNLSQAGVGEYKILKQIESTSLDNFDLVIVSHTSPSRIHTVSHPIHRTGFHKNCDLIYTDLEHKNSFFNISLRTAKNWFRFHYDDQYQIDIYNLIREKINNLCTIPYISISHARLNIDVKQETNFIDFFDIWKNHRGKINHYDDAGNQQIYEILKNKINKII